MLWFNMFLLPVSFVVHFCLTGCCKLRFKTDFLRYFFAYHPVHLNLKKYLQRKYEYCFINVAYYRGMNRSNQMHVCDGLCLRGMWKSRPRCLTDDMLPLFFLNVFHPPTVWFSQCVPSEYIIISPVYISDSNFSSWMIDIPN